MTGKEIRIYRNLMGKNKEWAEKTRALLLEKNISMINIIGSPGCGKTTFLEKSIGFFKKSGINTAVLEGDVETDNDARRIDALGIPAYQLLTDGACHLEAKLVHYALLDLPLDNLDIVIVENVGNLVCPAEFDIGENSKIAVLSVTEGEDKPEKYPLLFSESDAVILSKTDLIPYTEFNTDACLNHIKKSGGNIPVFQISFRKQESINICADWIIKTCVSK